MKTIAIIFLSLIGLRAFAQNRATLMVDLSGNIVAPSRSVFLHSNVFNQSGIIRSVDGPTNLFNAAPLRSGEHVIVIEAGTFGNGGAALFTHDAGSSNPTNTTDTLAASPGRWVVRTVFSSPPAWASITGKPNSLDGLGVTNAFLPLSAGSNSPISGDLYLSAFVLNGTRYTNVSSSTNSGSGGPILEPDIPPEITRDSEATATYAAKSGNNIFTGANQFDGTTVIGGSLFASNIVVTNLFLGTNNVANLLTNSQSSRIAWNHLFASLSAATIASNATYYAPLINAQGWSSITAYDQGAMIVPEGGYISQIGFRFRVGTGSTPSTNNVLFYIRTNNVSDIGPFTLNFSAGSSNVKTNFGDLNIPLNSGDTYAIKIVSPPTWTVAPTISGSVDVYFK